MKMRLRRADLLSGSFTLVFLVDGVRIGEVQISRASIMK
jgi:hypothetical protein